MRNKIISFSIVLILSSCVVSKKKYDDLNITKSSLEVEKAETASALEVEKAKTQQLELENETQSKKITKIEGQKQEVENNLKTLQEQYKRLSDVSSADAQKLELERKKADNLRLNLEQKDKALTLKSKELEQKNKELELKNEILKKDKEQVDSLNLALIEREKKVAELQKILKDQEDLVERLRSKVANALLSFSDDELQIEVKDGKVYVSLAENLLFKSGQYKIDEKGIQALNKLSVVLAKQEDLDIVVEGHTDDVPYNGSGKIKDNWDLSVLRATTVVRELQKNNVKPEHLIATGRGEHLPKKEGETKEIRAINRRIEIIISPQLNELFQILDSKNKAE